MSAFVSTGPVNQTPTTDLSWQARASDFLTRPHPAIKQVDKQREVRFVSAAVIVSPLLVLLPLISGSNTLTLPDLILFVATLVSAISIYALSRSRHGERAALPLVIQVSLTTLLTYAVAPHDTTLYFFVIPVLLAGVLFSTRTTAVVVVVMLAAFIAITKIFETEETTIAIEFLALFSVLTLFFVSFRNEIETTRTKRLDNALAEVQDLNGALASSNEDLRKANALAKEATRLKSEFLATMSHELRTPLNAMIGFSGILLDGMGGEFDDETRHMIERIMANSQRLLTLINDVLDIAKIEAGRLEVTARPFKPRDLVATWKAQLGVLAEQKKLDFDIFVAPELPSDLIGDPERISQIAVNLLSNAFKFTETGAVTLDVRCRGDEWTIQVRDSGIGIPPHALNYIFDEFRQIDGSSRRAYGGTGLGLAIVRNLCRVMGGQVKVESQLGTGSTFTVSLPMTTAAAATKVA